MEEGKQKFKEMVNRGDLGNKPSEKLQLPEKDLNYLCENSCRFLGAPTTERNQRHSNPATENKNRDEGQEDVANMICKLFQQQGAPEVEVVSLVAIIWNIKISPQCSRK